MHKDIMDAIKKSLKYWTVDWKLGNLNREIQDLMKRLELVLSRMTFKEAEE